jgi:hypothetical protein
MGYASYLEDILDRLNEDLLDPARQLLAHPPDDASTEFLSRIDVFVRVCDQIQSDICKHIDLATDPNIKLTDELIRVQEREAQCNQDLNVFKAKCEKLALDNARLRFLIDQQRKKQSQISSVLNGVTCDDDKLKELLERSNKTTVPETRPNRGGLD